MNRFKYIAIALLTLCTGVYALAQDEVDALRYSYLAPQATARSMGIGNAGGSVGADFSSLSINPAGIGVYRNGEMMITPSIKANSVSGTYLGSTTSDDKLRFTINNAGIVFSRAAKGRRYERSKWKASSFAFGFNRLADFNRNYVYSGKNGGKSGSSGSEVFVADANGNINDLNYVQNYSSLASLGYQSYLINYDTNIGLFRTVVPYDTTGLNQRRRVHEKGSMNEMVFSFGGNYMEKLMLGATIGIPFIRYDRVADYTEALDAPTSNFSNYTYTEKLTTKGTGINLKLGFIYKPSDYFRFGAAIHTPSYMAMTDEYLNSISYNAQLHSGEVANDPGTIDYTLTTPWRAVVSATGFMGKYGFITADYEFVNYRAMRYHFQSDFIDYESSVNQLIKNTYTAASNFRIGIEGRPIDFMMVRVGCGYYGTPYSKSIANASHIDLSAGIGFRFSHWFTDLGFVHTMYNGQEQPYVLPYPAVVVPTATLKNSLNNAALTIGLRF
ncbi:MAG: hypothetical protein BGO69_07855 [Bacteroidetes bacterium 46-16]|nr:MAG: hypothetical protein BGO69_07855 [Bacteroidetes bacterium 46-16]